MKKIKSIVVLAVNVVDKVPGARPSLIRMVSRFPRLKGFLVRCLRSGGVAQSRPIVAKGKHSHQVEQILVEIEQHAIKR